MNSVSLMGNVGSDPELKSTNGGQSVLKISLATNRDVKRGDKWEKETDWHRVTVFGKRAEGLAKHVQKGTSLAVTGSIRYSSYTDRDGVKRYSTEIVADTVEFAGRSGGSGSTRGSEAPSHYEDDGMSDASVPF